MNVFVTGGTGYIGTAVLDALHAAGHSTVALVRSEAGEAQVRDRGSLPLRGDLQNARDWLPALPEIDGVIHMADTFDERMRAAESAFLDHLLPWIAARVSEPLPFVYTGGLWLYGENGSRTVVEGSPFDPPPPYAYMADHRVRLAAADVVSLRVLHPAMVWHEEGGVLQGYMDAAQAGRPPEITGNASARWPLVHRDDLARLYVSVLERGEQGRDYHGVAETGVPVCDLATAIARRWHAPLPVVQPVADAVRALGEWAACLAWDQTMDAPLTRATLGWSPAHAGALKTLSHDRVNEKTAERRGQ